MRSPRARRPRPRRRVSRPWRRTGPFPGRSSGRSARMAMVLSDFESAIAIAFGGEPMSRVAVVTGAASGMGHAISGRLAQQGHAVAMLDLSGDAVEQAAKELRERGANVMAAAVDVSDRTAVDDALAHARADL